MVPPKLSRIGNNGVEGSSDLISKVPMLVTDKILGHLTLSEKAKMSVLSKKWRHNWSCINSIVIDDNFWEERCKEDGKLDLKKGSNIISSILLCHNGTINTFHLAIPENDAGCEETLNLSPWLCFLSRNGVKNITLENYNLTHLTLPSAIFSCIELEELELDNFIINPPPADFECFKHLQKLELICIKSKHDMIDNLIANCPNLVTLSLIDYEKNSVAKHLVINAPSLQNLAVAGKVESITIKNAHELIDVALCLPDNGMDNHLRTDIIDAFITLATSSALKILLVESSTLKLLVAGGKMNLSLLAFMHLEELYLRDLELDDFGIYSITCCLIQSCPYIKKLAISVTSSKNLDVQHNFTHDGSYKFEHLREVEFDGITGSCAELQMIKYLLRAANVLEKLIIVLDTVNKSSEIKLQRELNGFRRASFMAQIVFLEKSLMWQFD